MAFKEKFFPALKRAAWTAIEFGLGTAIVAIPVGAAFDEVDWARLVSIALVATLISLLKSILLSMPEVNQETEIAYLREEIQRLMGFHDDKDVVDVAADPDEVTTILDEDAEITPENPEDTFGPAESEDTEEVDGE